MAFLASPIQGEARKSSNHSIKVNLIQRPPTQESTVKRKRGENNKQKGDKIRTEDAKEKVSTHKERVFSQRGTMETDNEKGTKDEKSSFSLSMKTNRRKKKNVQKMRQTEKGKYLAIGGGYYFDLKAKKQYKPFKKSLRLNKESQVKTLKGRRMKMMKNHLAKNSTRPVCQPQHAQYVKTIWKNKVLTHKAPGEEITYTELHVEGSKAEGEPMAEAENAAILTKKVPKLYENNSKMPHQKKMMV